MILATFLVFAIYALCPMPTLLMLPLCVRSTYLLIGLKPLGLLPPVGGPDKISLQNKNFLVGLSALSGK